MGRVLIIKNCDEDKRINEFARKSFEQGKKYYYNAVDGTINEQALIGFKENFTGNGIVIMITYENTDFKDIKDVYIGDGVNINEKNSIEYTMRVCLTRECHQRVIESILDKIDLDVDADFGYGRFVIMNDMDSLYQELRERIIASRNKCKNIIDEQISKGTTEESYTLCDLAQKDIQSLRIYETDSVGVHRTEFQRDRERVVNCKAFRRLVDKAQIFGSEKGDYYRTRMTHSLEVNQIAKAIAYALRLNMDLTEAIALGHDLGHTPFGHQGERTLDEILGGKKCVGIVATDEMFKQRCFGGFKHNYQSAKILTEIEEKYKRFPGLNVSVQVVEGVLKHTKLKPSEIALEDFLSKEYIEKININDNEEYQVCSSLEGQVVAIADEIAQRGHDVDDALTSGVMTIEEFKDRLIIDKCKELYNRISDEIKEVEILNRLVIDKKELGISRIVTVIVNYFINKTINYSLEQVEKNRGLGKLTLDNNVLMVDYPQDAKRVNNYLEKVVQKKVICNNEVARADYNADTIVQKLFEKYYKNPRLLHSGTVHKIFIETLNHPNKEVSNSAIYMGDARVDLVNKEIEEITTCSLDENVILRYLLNREKNISNEQCEHDIVVFEKRRILIRAITDFIAGMTDGYALEEYEKLK